jgi:hypothetical protein
MGAISAHMFYELCSNITGIEDIVANDATHIADIVERAVKHVRAKIFNDVRSLFKFTISTFLKLQSPADMHIACGVSTTKCSEVCACLRASLMEIDDRWCDGKVCVLISNTLLIFI